MRLSMFAAGLALALSASPVLADSAAHKPKPAAATLDRAVAEIQRALDEQRLMDAGRLLDDAALAGADDPRLILLDGELELQRGRLSDALGDFTQAANSPVTAARGLQGEGLVLSLTGASEKALPILQSAVAKDPTAWRAWNALGSEYDARGQWGQAEAAYQTALTASGGAAIVLNNRGYSRLLQRRREEAVADLVAALRKKPDLAEARTNLRLALAMGGDYDGALAGGSPGDKAALLNNAGFAAAMRGDYHTALDLLNRAIATKSEYYERASENLKIVQALAGPAQAQQAHAAP
ncbi:tetratricopeptide repeat protein [Phenylobacterium montanum]|uniref:Tetratricopeptide repeat protein n=1 Tax=Phenylobacterium montanum TaxID=2823693 RepID=A0A975IWP0_9CAUL|nr:tetratricopeptide repeat protein [Caulobacter sp. S6]QUD88576.1 tetratricopeptide repeat protein [Caulobacter sp. S6]